MDFRAGCLSATRHFRSTTVENVASISSNRSPLQSSSIDFRKIDSLPKMPFFFSSESARNKADRRLTDWRGSSGGKNGRNFYTDIISFLHLLRMSANHTLAVS